MHILYHCGPLCASPHVGTEDPDESDLVSAPVRLPVGWERQACQQMLRLT